MLKFKSFAVVCGCVLSIYTGLNGSPAKASYAGNLEVKFSGLKNSNGQVCMTIFSGPKGFPAGGKGTNLIGSRCVTLANGSGTVTFTNLPYGNYAIAAIHDINKDGSLNKNALGIPSEGFGFSNNPPIRFGPASFADAQFFASGVKTVVQIQMRYLS